mgnify:CR=1 FL=1
MKCERDWFASSKGHYAEDEDDTADCARCSGTDDQGRHAIPGKKIDELYADIWHSNPIPGSRADVERYEPLALGSWPCSRFTIAFVRGEDLMADLEHPPSIVGNTKLTASQLRAVLRDHIDGHCRMKTATDVPIQEPWAGSKCI